MYINEKKSAPFEIVPLVCVCVLIQCELYLASSLQQLFLPNESLRKCARRPEFTCDFSARLPALVAAWADSAGETLIYDMSTTQAALYGHLGILRAFGK